MSGKKETILKGDYCPKHVPLPQTKAIENDIAKISQDLFAYIKLNETTYTCECYTKAEEKNQCYNDFLENDK